METPLASTLSLEVVAGDHLIDCPRLEVNLNEETGKSKERTVP